MPRPSGRFALAAHLDAGVIQWPGGQWDGALRPGRHRPEQRRLPRRESPGSAPGAGPPPVPD